MGLVPKEAMLEAVELVINGERMSICKVAKDKGISKSALARYIKKYQADKSCKLAPNYKHSQIFNPVQEADLAKYLTKCSQMFHGLTPKNTRKLAFLPCMSHFSHYHVPGLPVLSQFPHLCLILIFIVRQKYCNQYIYMMGGIKFVYGGVWHTGFIRYYSSDMRFTPKRK